MDVPEEVTNMPGTGNPYADTSAMYMVHDMFRREFALLPDLVGGMPESGRSRGDVADHVTLMCYLLHHHHLAEDVLWPLLLARAPREVDPVVRLSESQHQAIDDLLTETGKRLAAWRDAAAPDSTGLALTLRRLAVTAFEHMGLEEKLVLPLVERHVFAAEWEAMEQASLASLEPDQVVLTIGMLMYEVGPGSVPAAFPPEVLRVAPQAYAAHAARVHRTPTPPRSADLAIGTPAVGLACDVDERREAS